MPGGFVHCMRMDLWRCAGACSAPLFFRTWLVDPAFRPVFTLRLCQALAARGAWARPLFLLARLWHIRTQACCGVDLPWSLRIGAGFKLLHGWGIVINADARIGSNVTVMQGVTIGGTGRGVPTLQDDVTICANATVIGGVTLGHGAVVGAACCVTHDVTPGATVIGNPQREIVRGTLPRRFNRAPVGEAAG